MELLTSVGEHVGCLLMLSQLEGKANEGPDLVLSTGGERVAGS